MREVTSFFCRVVAAHMPCVAGASIFHTPLDDELTHEVGFGSGLVVRGQGVVTRIDKQRTGQEDGS